MHLTNAVHGTVRNTAAKKQRERTDPDIGQPFLWFSPCCPKNESR
jgi:hypothetical protein